MSELRRGLIAAALIGSALAWAGCGDASSGDTTPTVLTGVTTPAADEPGATTPSVPTTASVPTTTAPTTTSEPDAGDEEGIRVPATFTVDGAAVSPSPISVPPFLRIQVTARSTDGKAHVLRFATRPAVTVQVPANGAGEAEIPGQRKGSYSVSVDGGPAQPGLLAADDVGP